MSSANAVLRLKQSKHLVHVACGWLRCLVIATGARWRRIEEELLPDVDMLFSFLPTLAGTCHDDLIVVENLCR
jgi:hypothetical protein